MYEYFISYNIKTEYKGYDRCGVGNVNFVLKRKITNIDDIREIEIRIKEKEKEQYYAAGQHLMYMLLKNQLKSLIEEKQ